MTIGDFDLGDELLAGGTLELFRHGFAHRKQLRHDEQHIDRANTGDDQSDWGEAEKGQFEIGTLRREICYQQVGRRADQRRHAAKDREERQGHQNTGRRLADRGGNSCQDRQKHHHNRGVVQECAERRDSQENRDRSPQRPAARHLDDRLCRCFQRIGLEQSLTNDQEADDCYQRRI